jgi:ABC-2 type transport system ATP-binding protein
VAVTLIRRLDSTAAMLRLSDVSKRYGGRGALDRACLGAGSGEVVGLLGPNGAGKSTLVSIIAGVQRPDSGEVLVDGIDVARHPASVARRIGLGPQETSVYEVLTVGENLAFFAELVGLRRRARAARIEELTSAFELGPLIDRPASQLSGGERRRLHTAIAFVHRPRLLLLDEATVGADIETRAAILDVVRAAADDGTTILYSTHYLPEVETLGATVAILVAGRVIASGPLNALIAAHGQGKVELTFAGPPPSVELGRWPATIDGNVVRIDAADPAGAVPIILDRLGAQASFLRGVEVLRPSLDSVFLTLTGRRYAPDATNVSAA